MARWKVGMSLGFGPVTTSLQTGYWVGYDLAFAPRGGSMECIRIHASYDDVPVEKALRATAGHPYEATIDSSRIVCVNGPEEVQEINRLGLQYAHIDHAMGDTPLLGQLASLSPVQVQHVAKTYEERMRIMYGFVPPNLVIVIPEKWHHLIRGRKYRRNLKLLIHHLGSFRLFFVFGSESSLKWRGLNWMIQCGVPFFVVSPRVIEDQDGAMKMRRKMSKLGVEDFGIVVPWLPFDGHYQIAENLGIRAVMTTGELLP